MGSNAADTAGEWWDASGGRGALDRLRSNPVPVILAGVGLTWLAMTSGGGRRLQRIPDATQRVGRRSRNLVASIVRDYPLAVAGAAAILGASLGMVVPETERENELMGETRESALKQAQDATSGAIERAKEAVTGVTRAAIGE